MNEKRFETVQTRLLFVLAEANRHRTRIAAAGVLNAQSDRFVLDTIEQEVSDMWRTMFGLINAKESTDVRPTVRPYQDFQAACQKQLPNCQSTVEAVLLHNAEVVSGLCQAMLVGQFPLRPGINISEDGICYGVFVDHPWYGFGPRSWHGDESDARYNAAITNGKVATVRRDQDGHYEVPLEERLALGVTSSAV